MSASNSESVDLSIGGLKEILGITSDSSADAATAKAALAPVINGSFVAHAFSPVPGLDLARALKEIHEQATSLAKDDSTEDGEMMLVAQAKALDSIFCKMALLAEANMEHHFAHSERLLKLSLKAQTQSRCTWETLSRIKNPPNVSFVKQANYSQGHQQVNNGGQCAAQTPPPRTQENQKSPNELLEEQHSERLDFGATKTAGRNDTALEAVGSVNRTKNGSRKAEG